MFWRSEVDPPVLPVSVLSVPRSHSQADFENLSVNTTVLILLESEHVLLRGGARSVRLEITHGSVLAGPARLSHDLRGRETVRQG